MTGLAPGDDDFGDLDGLSLQRDVSDGRRSPQANWDRLKANRAIADASNTHDIVAGGQRSQAKAPTFVGDSGAGSLKRRSFDRDLGAFYYFTGCLEHPPFEPAIHSLGMQRTE